MMMMMTVVVVVVVEMRNGFLFWGRKRKAGGQAGRPSRVIIMLGPVACPRPGNASL